MMIRFALQDGESPIKLLDKDESHHLVAECHGRERQLGVGAVIRFLREAVRPANDENHPFCSGNHLFLNALCEANGGQLLAVFVQEYNVVGGLQLLGNQRGLGLFLLLFAEGPAVARVGQFLHFERDVVPDAAHIFLDARGEVVLVRFPYGEQNGFHGQSNTS